MKMATWNSRGLRGSTLEELINLTNQFYREKKLALVQKIPTPIKPIKIDQESRHITLAYFDQKSTVDYIGVVQGFPICFDAKECGSDRFSLKNIHSHQMEFMKEFEEQGGISFFLIYFTNSQLFYYLRYEEALEYFERAKNGHGNYFKQEEINQEYVISCKNQIHIHYLECINKDLLSRKKRSTFHVDKN